MFRTFLSRKEFPRFPSRCERFRKRGRRRFFLPLHVNGEGVFFPRGNKLPFLMHALSRFCAPRGEVFFLSFVEGKADKREGCDSFF